VEEVVITVGTMSLKDIFAIIKVDNNNNNVLINAIPFKDGNNFNEEGDKDSY